MVTLITISKNQTLPYMLSYGAGVYRFNFTGELTYTDDDNITWEWEGLESDAPVILGVRTSSIQLTEVSTLAACIATDTTYFYDSSDDGSLYVHWDGSVSDYSVGREYTVLQRRDTDKAYSSAYSALTGNLYNSVFYRPIAKGFEGFSLETDSLDYGLLSRQQAKLYLDNTDGRFRDTDNTLNLGSIVDIRTIADDETDYDNSIQRFKGYTNGAIETDEEFSLNIIEQIFYNESPICQNTFKYLTYPDLEDAMLGELIPVSLGYIRRGKCVPVNTDGFDKSVSNEVTYVVSDPSLGPINSVTGLYDSDGAAVSGYSYSLTNCTITYTIPANSDTDYRKFTWSGTGLAENYDEPVQMMIWAFSAAAGIPYLSDTFDTTSWAAVATEYDNSARVGLVIDSDRSFVEEIIQPISHALQAVIYTKGDGILSISIRDTSASSVRDITYKELFEYKKIDHDIKDFASSVVVNYAINAVDKNDFVQFVYKGIGDTAELETIKTYGKQSTGGFSPIKSVLYDDNDNRLTEFAESILDISNDPKKKVSIRTVLTNDSIVPLSIITCDLGRGDEDDNNRIEVEKIEYDYLNYQVILYGRVL